MKNLLKCSKCGKEFISIDEASEHSKEEGHFVFTINSIQEMEVMIC